MVTAHHCRGCGAEVPPDAPFGHCPKCLVKLGFLPEANAGQPSELPPGNAGRRFADYELGRQIGRGGMGVSMKPATSACIAPWRSK